MSWVVSYTPRPLDPEERAPGTHWIGRWVGLSTDLFAAGSRTIPRASSLTTTVTDCTIPASLNMSTISYVNHKEQQYAVSGTVKQATRDCPRLKLWFRYSSLCKSLSVAACKVMLTDIPYLGHGQHSRFLSLRQLPWIAAKQKSRQYSTYPKKQADVMQSSDSHVNAPVNTLSQTVVRGLNKRVGIALSI